MLEAASELLTNMGFVVKARQVVRRGAGYRTKTQIVLLSIEIE